MHGYVTNLEQAAEDNTSFRRVLYTAKLSQLVLMHLKPKEEIGMETHKLDQFVRIESGNGVAILDGIQHPVESGTGVVIPAGVTHNIVNVSPLEALKLYTVYTPPAHADGTVIPSKAEDKAFVEDFNGHASD